MIQSRQDNQLQNSPIFAGTEWADYAQKYQQAMEGGDETRLKLALALSAQEYHHPESEMASASIEKRNFCFCHQKITDRAILAIHGWTACPYEMRELGEYLFNLGFNVFGVRLAGHGTKVEDYAKYGQKDWEESAKKGLGIASLLGKKVVIIGESMGGALAIILAVSFPELVSKIILYAPCLQIADWRSELTRFSWFRSIRPEVDFSPLPDWQKENWYSKIPVTGVAELAKIARKARKLGGEILRPTLIIQAANDKMVNPNGAKRFFNTLGSLTSAEKRLILFDNGHHNLTMDINPAKKQLFEWTVEFIGK